MANGRTNRRNGEYPWNLLHVVFPDSELSEYVDVETCELDSAVKRWLNTKMTEKEQDVLRLIYKEGYTLSKCGKEIGLSCERIRQIEAKAIRKLRCPYRVKELRRIARDQTQ